MSNFFSQITGFNNKYIETSSKIEEEKETDFSDVDFCQGDITDETFNFNDDINVFEDKNSGNKFNFEG